MYISLIVCLIQSLQHLLETTAQCYATIRSIYVSHGSALTQNREGGKWVHLT